MSIWMMGAYAALAVYACEMLIYFVAPNWLARLAWSVVPEERRMTPGPPRVEGAYRDGASDSLGLSRSGRVNLEDAVLIPAGDGRTFALRRAFGFGFRQQPFLLRIEVDREGDDVVMRAREGFPWVSGILVFAWLILQGMSGASHQPMFVIGLGAGGLAGTLIGRARRIGPRDAALRAAFDHLEGEVRDATRSA